MLPRSVPAWILICFLLAEMIIAGCASSPWSSGSKGSQGWVNPSFAKPTAAASTSPKPNIQNQPVAPANSQANAQNMQLVMEELRQLGTLDPLAQNKLMKDLKQTDPALWPLVMQQFRAAIAYKRRTAERQAKVEGGNLSAAANPAADSALSAAPGFLSGNSPAPGVGSDLSPAAAANAAGTTTVQRLPAAGSHAADGLNQTSASRDAASAANSVSSSSPPVKRAAGADKPVGSPTVKGLVDERPVKENGNSVVSASYNAEIANESADWREQLSAAIQALEGSASGNAKTEESLAQQARLRMLYMLADRRDEALKPLPGGGPAMQEFWSKELYGLAMLLDSRPTPDDTNRLAESKQVLGEALSRLGETAQLVVRNLAFCTAVQSYGCYTPFKKNEFTPDQEVLLYAEMDNFAAESTPKGFHTMLRSSYQIFDAGGHRVADHTFTTTEEYCQNPRRDFFIGFHLRMPQRINPGKYTLQLTIEDVKSQKVGQSSIDFAIKEAEK